MTVEDMRLFNKKKKRGGEMKEMEEVEEVELLRR